MVFLPHKLKKAGWVLLSLGILFSLAYAFLDFRFTMPVIAVFSYFTEAKYFAVFETNFADELAMISLLSGLFILSFTREKKETDLLDQLRNQALKKTLLYNSVFVFCSILFVYGVGFLGAMVLNLFSPLIIYLVLFYRSVSKHKANPKNKV